MRLIGKILGTVMAVALGASIGSPATVQSPCTHPIDEETLSSLTISPYYPTWQVTPGALVDLQVYRLGPDQLYEPIDACVDWSVNTDYYASIEPGGRQIRINPAIAFSGGHFTLTANIEEGRRILSVEVWVYRPAEWWVVGRYSEGRRWNCAGVEVTPAVKFPLIEFRADGRWYAVRTSSDSYDLQGTYVADYKRGLIALSLGVESFPVEGFDGFGMMRVAGNGTLRLEKLSFGKFGSGDPKGCEYELEPHN